MKDSIPASQGATRVYCAGPLFNQAERGEMERIGELLRKAGFEPFVPHADGMEFSQVLPYLMERGFEPADAGQLLHAVIFDLDVYQVVAGCGALVFNMNGRVPDEGGVAELTIAWMLGKPVVIYKEDVRSKVCGRDNPLVVGQTEFDVVSQLDVLCQKLRERIAACDAQGHPPVACPPHLRKSIDRGGRLWAHLQSLGDRSGEAVGPVILELYAQDTPPIRIKPSANGRSHSRRTRAPAPTL